MVDKENHDVFQYDFDLGFVKNFQKFIASNLQPALDQLKIHLDNYNKNSASEDKNSEEGLINELTDYRDLFQKLATKFNRFISCVNGEHALSEMEAHDYEILINYVNNKHKFNFYELINQLINNSFKIIGAINEPTTPKTVDFNILLNIRRYLQKFIQTNFLSTVYQRQVNTTAAMLIKNEQLFFKAMDFALPDFILEVRYYL